MTKISSKKIEGLKVLVFICVEAHPTVVHGDPGSKISNTLGKLLGSKVASIVDGGST